ncbi:branched-chain amino acid ABC transporter permease/ATP-binding protein [Frankia sp. AvcI1]|uniref:branched-chain amino acid ABC transporter permease/ATP-binding protein n=1 Tax=Frankia sp. AvcI1 TaxID=573496 RepID=UPI00211840C9|nr:branched-chain amino acid ABC transporter permease/ATP-binding protein [Frankia sp. AvcI1]
MTYLPYLIAGLVTGSVYGLAATGLVLTYKTSGLFNLGHGALATVAAYLFYELNVHANLPWGLAAAICVLVGGPVLGLLFELIARSLGATGLSVRIASTIGFLLVVVSIVSLRYDSTTTRVVPQYLPQSSFHLGSTPITAAQVIIAVLGVTATAALAVFFRRARLGAAMRAVVDDGPLLDAAGTSALSVRRWSWIIGATFAATSGVLLAPLLAELNPLNLTFLVVTAFGAAAIGRFSSLPLTYGGGLVIGVAQQLCTKQFTTGVLTGLAPALPFLVLFVVLLISSRRRLSDDSRIVPRSRALVVPWPVQGVGGAAVLVLLAFIPQIDTLHLTDWTNALSYVILFLSLGLLVRTSGQVSLCHVSFMAIGVSAMSHLTQSEHLPWLLALIVSGLIAIPVGAVLAIPAIRLSGLYLALATFGFGILLQYMFYTEHYMFGESGVGLTLSRPAVSWLSVSSDKGYYYLVLVLAAAAAATTLMITRSRLGRLLRALADSPVGLATSGSSINVTRILVFCLSAFLAAEAGALQGVSAQQVSGDAYSPLLSLTFFALIMIVPGRDPWYALFASFGLILIPALAAFSGATTATCLQLLFGAAALLLPLSDRLFRQVSERLSERLPAALPARWKGETSTGPSVILPSTASVAAGHAGSRTPPRLASGSLDTHELTVRFGGVVAVDGVSLSAPVGRITGLIGPNGAGKTTTFNACSGLLRPAQGRVELDGRDVTRRGPAARARLGLGRTFQQMQLFDSLPVYDNVAMGAEARFAGSSALRQLSGTRAQMREVRRAADEAMELCGITDLAARPAGALSTGQRRLVDLARALAGHTKVLLLDEPSSGLDRAETVRFGDTLLEVVGARGVGILLVEHDMGLVTRVCDHIYVLDFGRQIFDGPPADVVASAAVREAYLGGSVAEPATSPDEQSPADTEKVTR